MGEQREGEGTMEYRFVPRTLHPSHSVGLVERTKESIDGGRGGVRESIEGREEEGMWKSDGGEGRSGRGGVIG